MASEEEENMELHSDTESGEFSGCSDEENEDPLCEAAEAARASPALPVSSPRRSRRDDHDVNTGRRPSAEKSAGRRGGRKLKSRPVSGSLDSGFGTEIEGSLPPGEARASTRAPVKSRKRPRGDSRGAETQRSLGSVQPDRRCGKSKLKPRQHRRTQSAPDIIYDGSRRTVLPFRRRVVSVSSPKIDEIHGTEWNFVEMHNKDLHTPKNETGLTTQGKTNGPPLSHVSDKIKGQDCLGLRGNGVISVHSKPASADAASKFDSLTRRPPPDKNPESAEVTKSAENTNAECATGTETTKSDKLPNFCALTPKFTEKLEIISDVTDNTGCMESSCSTGGVNCAKTPRRYGTSVKADPLMKEADSFATKLRDGIQRDDLQNRARVVYNLDSISDRDWRSMIHARSPNRIRTLTIKDSTASLKRVAQTLNQHLTKLYCSRNGKPAMLNSNNSAGSSDEKKTDKAKQSSKKGNSKNGITSYFQKNNTAELNTAKSLESVTIDVGDSQDDPPIPLGQGKPETQESTESERSDSSLTITHSRINARVMVTPIRRLNENDSLCHFHFLLDREFCLKCRFCGDHFCLCCCNGFSGSSTVPVHRATLDS